jgi:hypothetical protein
MLKRNYFFLISLLVVMALVFGVPGGADAKDWPLCPFEEAVDIVGPAWHGHMRFFVDSGVEKVTFNGRCRNVEINETFETEWFARTVPPGPALLETDLVVYGSPDESWNLIIGADEVLIDDLADCYREELLPGEPLVFCLQFLSVHNFDVILENEDYEADVILLRAIPARK